MIEPIPEKLGIYLSIPRKTHAFVRP